MNSPRENNAGDVHAPIPADTELQRVEWVLSTLLRFCVIASLVIMILGTIITFAQHPDFFSSPDSLHTVTGPGHQFPHTASDVIDGVRQFQGQAIVVVGLLMLIITPVLRVAVSCVAFTREKDWAFAFLTGLVLLILAGSFVLGRAH